MPRDIQSEIGARLFTLEESDLAPLRKIQRRIPNNIDLNYVMGSAYLRMGHAEEGLRYYERADRLLEGKDTSMKQVIEMAKQGHFIKPTCIFGDGTLML